MKLGDAMLEKDLQRAVLQRARELGWRIAHFTTSRSVRHGAFMTAQQGHPGFPDLVLLRPPRLVFAELKTKRGKVSQEQALWLNGLNTVAGVEQYEWRPEDWQLGRIEDVLR